jgi:hypothetical protein
VPQLCEAWKDNDMMSALSNVLPDIQSLFVGPLAFTYLDPSSGSLIIQILAAGLLSLTFFLGAFWRKIKKLLGFFHDSTQDVLTNTTTVKGKPEDKERRE